MRYREGVDRGSPIQADTGHILSYPGTHHQGGVVEGQRVQELRQEGLGQLAGRQRQPAPGQRR